MPVADGREEIVQAYADYVSPGKVASYRTYDMVFVPEKRNGCYIRDMNGRRFINCHSNGGVFNLGHRNRRIIAAVAAAMKTYDIGNHHLISKPKAALARRIAGLMPPGLDQVVYGVGGGEAIDLAIKLARGVTGRAEIISARGGYHGHTGFALAAGDKKFKEKFRPMPPGFRQVPFNDIAALEKSISKKTAAVIFETIPATLGIVVPDKKYFQSVRKLCDRVGALFILDEVQTGFARTGPLWGFENFHTVPDIVVLGKGMSGGIYPISATVYNRKYRQFFTDDPFLHISTFGGSEIGCCAALEALEISADKEFQDAVAWMGIYFRGAFESLAARYPAAGMKIRGIGLMMGLEFVDDVTSLMMMKLLFDNGVYVVYSGNDMKVLQFLPPLIVTEREGGEIVAALEKSLKALTGAGKQGSVR